MTPWRQDLREQRRARSRARLDGVTLADARRLGRRVDSLRRERDPARRAAARAKVEAALTEAEHRLERRRSVVPAIAYPEALPVSQRRDDIASAITDHQVVVVAGETGSGKTTQLPKICLELGRGVKGMIGHTQPRRLAARTVAARIAEELDVELGAAVGYAVRFTDHVGDDTLVKLMTDGILLNDIHRDRTLSAYDTIIVDEAHERSLNIDFILGYLNQLRDRRPDLKIIITSATIDPERFSKAFGDAPIVEVSGRTFPVEVRYHPLGGGTGGTTGDPRRDARDQVQGIVEAVDELRAEPPGDVLVFLSGEREIRDAAEALRGARSNRDDTEILPLYARLSTAEQQRVFAPHRGRRIVLATNVAETSLTVPGIRYVVDPGTARVSRYSHRLKVQRLPIEAVSQASANQRAGRCGRVAPGVCIRLYDEEDFDARPAFTEPEILRTNLASVILQMAALDLGDIAAFPFIDPPDRRAVTDGVRLLQELGALEVGEDGPGAGADVRLSPLGRRLARLPVDPRFGRMVLEADRLGCVHEVLIIAAALSIEDPRERPAEQRTQADQSHSRFNEPGSEFLALLNLWRYLRERQRELSGNQFRRMCRSEYLNYLRVREWQDVYSQLRRIAGEMGMKQQADPADPDAVHRALLSGLLSHIGLRDQPATRTTVGSGKAGGERDGRPGAREYRGPRSARFAIFPGSALARKPPEWIMAAELVETSRLWARTVAGIQPGWAEDLAPHLVTRAYSEPHWSTTRGAAQAYESVSLYGLPIVTRRLVNYARIDPDHARELFIRHALVEGDWKAHHKFLRHNRELLGELEEIEHRFRRNDLVAGADALERLYDERIDGNVVSGRHFDSWWKRVRRDQPDLLTFTAEDLLSDAAAELDGSQFPHEWQQGELHLPLTYEFRPGEADDGVTVHVPLALLNQLRADDFDWQVPGLRAERVAALIRSLPKAFRRHLLPVPDTAATVLARLEPQSEPMLDAVARELSWVAGERIGRESFDLGRVPPHLSVTFLIGDDEGNVLGEGKDLDALKRSLGAQVQAALARASSALERGGLRTWDVGELPRRHDDGTVVGFPALVDEGDSVAVRVVGSPDDQHEAHWAGIRRLLQLRFAVSTRVLRDRLNRRAGLALAANPYGSVDELARELVTAALDSLMAEHGAPVWDAVGFDRLVTAVRGGLEERINEVTEAAAGILVTLAEIDRRLSEPCPPALTPAYDDMAGQRIALVPAGFVTAMGAERLESIGRYLQAIVVRLDSVGASPGRDRDRQAQVQRVEAAYAAAVDRAPPDGRADFELERVGWMIEELRVSLFAQQLGTDEPVSAKRILRAIEAVPRA